MMKVLIVGEGKHELAGAMLALVGRLAPTGCVFDQANVRHDIHVHHGKGRGYFKRAVRWMLEAQKRGYDALVLLIDQDGFSERTKELADAQAFDGAAIPRALGVAIRSFDAWMLADERALSSVLGCAVSRQPDPETIVNPKESCSDLLANASQPFSQTQMYAEVAKAFDLDVVANRCPKGFAPFAERVRAIPPNLDHATS
jgi:hypothetical protein